jgi:hypothetical protein
MVYKEVHLKGVADLVNADIDAAAAIAKSKISTSGTWLAADIPSLDAAKITTGFLAALRGGLEKELVSDFQNDFVIVYKTADGKFHMQSLGAPAAHNFLDAATHNNTLAGTPVRGDLIVANSTPAWARFAKGTSSYFLVMGANDPAWTAFSATLHGTLATVGQHPDVVGGASGALTTTQHGALAGPASAHRWVDILKTTSSIADITTKDHDLLAGLGDDDHTQYLLGAGTRAMTGALRLALLSADPTLVDGMLLYRADLDTLYFAYDPGTGVIKKQVMLEGLLSAEGVYFGNGFLDTLTPYEMTGVGNGTFTKNSTWGKITSGAGANNQHCGYGPWGFAENVDYATYDKYPQFEIYVRFSSVAAMNFWCLWGGTANTPEGATEKKFGIKVIDGALWAYSGDGSAQSALDLSTALIASTWYRIRVKRTASGVLTYVDGVAKTEKTTNVPAGVSDINSTVQVTLKTTEAVDKAVYFRPVKLVHGQ